MHVRSEYKNRLAEGGAVVSGGDTPILKAPPVIDDAGEYIPSHNEAVAEINSEPEETPVAQEQIEAALDRARNGVRSEIPPAKERQYRPEPSGITYSAPVSRSEVPSGSSYRGSGRVTLTVAQKEAAKMAGVSESEYARQVLRLQEAKANGDYLESR